MDLIKRLRDDRHRWFNRPLNDGELRIWHLLCCEAADELAENANIMYEQEKDIERLTAALEKIRDLAGHGAEGWAVIDCQIEASEALAAVEEKDNE